MKAIRIHVRGGPEKLVYEDVPKPIPSADEALVRVYACGLTPTELSWSSAENLPVVVGHEVSGVVEALGPDVTEVKAGDAVYALTDFWRDGGAAEYVLVRGQDRPETRFNRSRAGSRCATFSSNGLASPFRPRRSHEGSKGSNSWCSRRRRLFCGTAGPVAGCSGDCNGLGKEF